MAKIVLRLGSVIPLTENLDVGEPVWDANKAALGLGNGERNPRFYPGINVDGSLKLNGRKIYSPNSDNNYEVWNDNGFSIFWNNKEVFRVDNKGVTAIADFTANGATIVGTGNNTLPPGGSKGQILAKSSNNNGDAIWVDPPTSGSGDPSNADGGIYDESPPPDNNMNLDGGVYSGTT